MIDRPDTRFSRREALKLTAASAFTAACTGVNLPATALAAQAAPPPRDLGSRKKGYAIVPARNPQWEQRLVDLRVRWYYNWGPNLNHALPPDIEFVPMMWRIYDNIADIAARLERAHDEGRIKHLMGFNEPDHPGQSNLTVEQCIEAWPYLQNPGIPLTSPGCAWMWGDWMRRFMREAQQRDYRIDIVRVHWYGNPAPQDFLQRVRSAYDLYKKPLWISEFAVWDRQANAERPNRHRPEDVARFMKVVLDELEQYDFVHRYSWFGRPNAGARLDCSDVFTLGGQLTDLGKLYASY